MELSASHEAPRNVRRLMSRSLGRRVRGKVASHRDENVTALVGVAPLSELANARLQHLVPMKARVFAQERASERTDQRLGGVAEKQMTGDEPRSGIHLLLAIERFEQRVPDLAGARREVIERLALLPRQPRGRNVEITGEIDRHCAMEHTAHGLDVSVLTYTFVSQPFEGLVHRIAVSEGVVRRFPVGVFVRGTEASHSERGRVGDRPPQVGRRSPGTNCLLDAVLRGCRCTPTSSAQPTTCCA